MTQLRSLDEFVIEGVESVLFDFILIKRCKESDNDFVIDIDLSASCIFTEKYFV